MKTMMCLTELHSFIWYQANLTKNYIKLSSNPWAHKIYFQDKNCTFVLLFSSGGKLKKNDSWLISSLHRKVSPLCTCAVKQYFVCQFISLITCKFFLLVLICILAYMFPYHCLVSSGLLNWAYCSHIYGSGHGTGVISTKTTNGIKGD